MSTFGKHDTVTHWTKYLQNFLDNTLVCGELGCIENWIELIRSSAHFASPREIRGGLSASWNLWKSFFKSDYPEFFLFLENRHFFLAGSRYIIAINRIKHPTVAKFNRIISTHKIYETVGIIRIVVKATIILLSKNREQFPWVLSQFRSNIAIKNFCLNLLHSIDSESPVFRKNLTTTE